MQPRNRAERRAALKAEKSAPIRIGIRYRPLANLFEINGGGLNPYELYIVLSRAAQEVKSHLGGESIVLPTQKEAIAIARS